MKLVLGCDHGGFLLKEHLKKNLKDCIDLGAKKNDPEDDYVDFAFKVALMVSEASKKDPFQNELMGVLLCRSAAGMVIAANKFPGVRAVAPFDIKSARHAREHNAANVIALSGDFLGVGDATKILEAFVNTGFSNEERHVRRIKKILAHEGL